jgi:acyl carrier protein
MTGAATLDRVQAIVAGVAGINRVPADAGPDTPLQEGGFWLDSAALVEVMIACEAAFDIVFDPETDFTDRALHTVKTLAELIHAKRPG